MESLKELQFKIDEIFHHFEEKNEVFPEGEYLKMMNLCKDIHKYVISEQQYTMVRSRVFCFNHHTNDCNCSADDLVRSLLVELNEIPRLHKIIAAVVAEQYGL